MKEQYINLMEKALSAYSDEHILRYFNDVKSNGLTEHGFPRLTANIGILIAHNRRLDLLPIFIKMMDLCCDQIPLVKAANDFSVREIVCCISELEAAPGTVSDTDISRWRNNLASIDPETCYNSYAKSILGKATNWAIFMSVSELFRANAGLRESAEKFIDLHLSHQMKWIDENGMYRDNSREEKHQPIMYDFVSRGLFVLLIEFGYRGKYFEQIDSYLKKAGMLSLDMQSPNGEMAFGGRSNQFLINEPWTMIVFEYEAKRYAREGNAALAAKFKAASSRALSVTEEWLEKKPIRHIKNRFSVESKHGCENYAYFDKYMITVASNLYAAYLICDDSIPFEEAPDLAPCAAKTSPYFHKLFMKVGGYGLEFDLDADPHYDANGLGRLHRAGAPSIICLSCPCPSDPLYTVNIEEPTAYSICSAIRTEDGWLLGADKKSEYTLAEYGSDSDSTSATLICRFENGRSVREHYTVSENGVSITLSGEGEIGLALPAFCFDGEIEPEITHTDRTLSISYGGWSCRYTADCDILDIDRIVANRNGHYRAFIATSQNMLNVKIEITENK